MSGSTAVLLGNESASNKCLWVGTSFSTSHSVYCIYTICMYIVTLLWYIIYTMWSTKWSTYLPMMLVSVYFGVTSKTLDWINWKFTEYVKHRQDWFCWRFGPYAWFTHVKQTASKLDTHAQYSVFYKMADESEFAPPLLLFVLLGVWQQTSSDWFVVCAHTEKFVKQDTRKHERKLKTQWKKKSLFSFHTLYLWHLLHKCSQTFALRQNLRSTCVDLRRVAKR